MQTLLSYGNTEVARMLLQKLRKSAFIYFFVGLFMQRGRIFISSPQHPHQL
jgi:hypothetical protein